jgi:ubiquinone biosynthesis protein
MWCIIELFILIFKIILWVPLILLGIKSIDQMIAYLGPFYVKLCQIATTRPDIFGLVIINRLKSLQDHVKPESIIFNGYIYVDPIASGSIAQVFSYSNTEIIKIKRCNLKIKENIKLITYVVKSWWFQYLSSKYTFIHSSEKLIDMLTVTLPQHLNFEDEVKNQNLFRNLLENNPYIIVPEISSWSNSHIIMNYVQGKPFHSIPAIFYSSSVELLLNLVYDMIFVHHIVHGDIHEGNILVNTNHDKITLGLIDFGIIYKIKESDVKLLEIFFISILTMDGDKLAQSMVKDVPVNNLFQEQLNNVLKSGRLCDIYSIIQDIINIATSYGIPLHESLFNPLLALIQVDGIAKIYSPNLKILDIIRNRLLSK